MYSTQFWIFFTISFFCLFATISCFTATLLDRPSVQQRNVFMTSGIVIFYIIGHILHFTATGEYSLLLSAKFEYTANLCLLAGIYNSLAGFYRTAPNRILISAVRAMPIPFIMMISMASNKTSFWVFNLFFKNFSVKSGANGLCELVFEHSPALYCYMVLSAIYALLIIGTFINNYVSSTKKERSLIIRMFMRLIPFLAVTIHFAFTEYKRPLAPVVPAVLFAATALCAYLVHKEKFRNLYDLSFFAVVDSLYDPLFVTDTNFFVRNANTAAKILFPEYHKANYRNQIQIAPELKEILSQAVYTMDAKNVRIASREFCPEPHRIERDGILYGYILVLNDVTEQSNRFMQLEHKNLQLSVDYKEIENDLLATRSKIVGGLIQYALEQDSYNGEHMRRTSNYTAILARQLQAAGKYAGTITNEYKAILCQVVPLHDAGKIILTAQNQSKLQDSNKEAGQEAYHSPEHVNAGAKLIDRLFVNDQNDLFFTLAKDVALYHHEWWDGSGYPKGLKGEEIPLGARIVALANEFDSLTVKRPPTVPFSFAEAYTTILSQSGIQFDPEIVEAFKLARKEFLDMYNQVTKSK